MPRVPPEGKRFKPGQSGNPAGRPPEPEILKVVRRLTKAEIAEMGTVLMETPIEELKRLAQDPKTPALKVMLAGMAVAAMKGNPAAFDKLLDRIVGKQKDRIELSGAVAVRQRYDALSDAELDAKLRAQTGHIAALLEDKRPSKPGGAEAVRDSKSPQAGATPAPGATLPMGNKTPK